MPALHIEMVTPPLVSLARRWLGKRYGPVTIQGLTTNPADLCRLKSSRWLFRRCPFFKGLASFGSMTILTVVLPLPFDTLPQAKGFLAWCFSDPSNHLLKTIEPSTLQAYFVNGDYLGAQPLLDEWVSFFHETLAKVDPSTLPPYHRILNLFDTFCEDIRGGRFTFARAPPPLGPYQTPLGLFLLRSPYGDEDCYPAYLSSIIQGDRAPVPLEAFTGPLRRDDFLVFCIKGKSEVWEVAYKDAPNFMVLTTDPKAASFLYPLVGASVIPNPKDGQIDLRLTWRDEILCKGVPKTLLQPLAYPSHIFDGHLNHLPFFLTCTDGQAEMNYSNFLQGAWPLLSPDFGDFLLSEANGMELVQRLNLYHSWSTIGRHTGLKPRLLDFESLLQDTPALKSGWNDQLAHHFNPETFFTTLFPSSLKKGATHQVGILGGAPTAWACARTAPTAYEDVDIFFVADNPLPLAVKAMVYFLDLLKAAKPLIRVGVSTITFYPSDPAHPFKPLQLVLVYGSSIEEAVLSFDLDVCQAALLPKQNEEGTWSGLTLLGTAACAASWLTGTVSTSIPLDSIIHAGDGDLNSYFSQRFKSRLAKYSAKGFDVDAKLKPLVEGVIKTDDGTKPNEPPLVDPIIYTLDSLLCAFKGDSCCVANEDELDVPLLQPLSLSIFDRSKIDSLGAYKAGSHRSFKNIWTLDQLDKDPLKQDVLKEFLRLSFAELQAAIQRAISPLRSYIPVCLSPKPLPFGITLCAWTLFERMGYSELDYGPVDQPTLKAEFWLPSDDPSFAILNSWGFLSEKQGYHLLHVRFVGSIEWAFSGTPIPLSESFVWPTQARIRLLVSGAALQVFCLRRAFQEERKVLTVDHGILYPPCLSHLVV